MREIKFRAWDIKANKMDNLRSNTWLEFCNYCSPQLVNSGAVGYERIATEDFILMQYTGLKDKNGKEIYESDMLYYPDHKGYVVVEYIDDMFHLKSLKLPNLSKGNFRLATLYKKLEVIGNIYENPELLENQMDEERWR